MARGGGLHHGALVSAAVSGRGAGGWRLPVRAASLPATAPPRTSPAFDSGTTRSGADPELAGRGARDGEPAGWARARAQPADTGGSGRCQCPSRQRSDGARKRESTAPRRAPLDRPWLTRSLPTIRCPSTWQRSPVPPGWRHWQEPPDFSRAHSVRYRLLGVDDGDVRARTEGSGVHLGLRRRLRPREQLRVPLWRLALWSGGGGLVGGRPQPIPEQTLGGQLRAGNPPIATTIRCPQAPHLAGGG